jgi:RNA polymerase I-specific transcription initiation factor RRN3
MMVGRFSEVAPPAEPLPGYPIVSRDTMRQRLHIGIRYILDLFPGARPILLNLVSSKFPYSDESKKIHLAFIDNLLRMREYSPDSRDIIELITSRAVKLDVEMQLDLEDMDDDTSAAVMAHFKPKETNDQPEGDDLDDSDTESILSDTSDLDDEARRILKMRNHVSKLDTMLDTLFDAYSPSFADPDSPEAVSCYEDILSDFSNIILPTYKSRHTQFLVFYFAQKSPRLTEMFVGTLFNIAFESNRPNMVKQSAVAYLASFVARGAKVDSEQVQTIASILLNYMDYHRTNYEPDCQGPDIRRYTQFYALTQGLLYLFCFRWRDLVNLESSSRRIDRDDAASFLGQDLEWMDGLKTRLQANIYSKLNPLKICSPVIVQEFAKLSHHLGLMYIYPRIESNKSIILSQFVSGGYSTGGALRDTGFDPQDEKWTQLDPYFPFDPYQLPGQFRHRLDEDQIYVPWSSIPGLNRDDEDDSDASGLEDGDEEDEDIEEDTATDVEDNDN